jgi:HD-GYP domain-containing protein (c-di-GMP phosphodiesterase class II)
VTAPREFLVSLAQAVAARRLYGPGHPRSRESVGQVVAAAEALLAAGESPRFTFLGPEVIHGDGPLRGVVPSEWTQRLSEVGVQRVELRGVPTPGEVEIFLQSLERALREGALPHHVRDADDEGPGTVSTLAWGPVRPRDEVETRARAGSAEDPAAPEGESEVDLSHELAAVEWIRAEVAGGAPLPRLEAEAVVRSLAVMLRGFPPRHAPRLPDAAEGYAARHALHTAVMTLAWVRELALASSEALALGLSGLLHDVGFARIDTEGVLDRPGPLDAEGRALVEAHPGEGGRLLLAAGAAFALPAVVAFEHHLLPDGEGYPAAGRGRAPHPAAQLVQLLSSYDSLRSTRPYRAALPVDEARETLATAGDAGAFAPELLVQFSRMDFERPARADTPPRS